VLPGSGAWSDAQRRAFVYRTCSRRNLSPSQEMELENDRRHTALELKKEGKRQIDIAKMLGVHRTRISHWLAGKGRKRSGGISIVTGGNNAYTPRLDCRVTVPPEHKPVILQRIASGETQQQVAADYGVSQARISQLVAKEAKQKATEAEKARKARGAGSPPVICLADWRDWISKQDQCDLLLTDPPYSTDVEDVAEFALDWLPACLGKVKPAGRAYVCIGAYPDELRAYLNIETPSHLTLNQVLVWTYRNTLGPSPAKSYKLNWQAILYYLGAEAGNLDCPKMTEQFSVQDIAAPDGRLGKRYHTWEKPEALAERFIRHATSPGDLVLDPFAGTGTFLLAAAKLKRIARGCDNSQRMVRIAARRGCDVEKLG